MKRYLSAVCIGKTIQELEEGINESIMLEEKAREGKLIEVINVSLSSCYDFKEGIPIYTAVVLWSYESLKKKKA